MSQRRIGVYVCHCGGNISDYVDVEQVARKIGAEEDVVVAKTAMFTCSDATQSEMEDDIRQFKLDGLVVASCSPKLHTLTFRAVAERAGLNPYQYTQVNVREQCSWAHTDDCEGATAKAERLVQAGVARTRLTEPLVPLTVETVPRTLIIGGGITGLRAAIGLADIGIEVVLVEKEREVGGWVDRLATMHSSRQRPQELIAGLREAIHHRPRITVFTEAQVVAKGGTFGNYEVTIAVRRNEAHTISIHVGSIIVATGFDVYQPELGEYGYGIEGVLTLPEFQEVLRESEGPLKYHGRPVETIAYVYCVGSRESEDQEDAHTYCSRYCCTATVHTALEVFKHNPKMRQYHLYRDMRTYGEYELLYSESRKKGSRYLKFAPENPPSIKKAGEPKGEHLTVTVHDQLTSNRELTISADLVVLVTGMIPRENVDLVHTLKLPVGKGGFYNEIHPKLRPVETVVDGVMLAGTCQNPKTAAESVAAGLAAATQSASILKKGQVQLDPQVAVIDEARCNQCGECLSACPYEAIASRPLTDDDKGPRRYVINAATCKGCGGCVPVCPVEAIGVKGYTPDEIRAMIDGLLREVVAPV